VRCGQDVVRTLGLYSAFLACSTVVFKLRRQFEFGGNRFLEGWDDAVAYYWRVAAVIVWVVGWMGVRGVVVDVEGGGRMWWRRPLVGGIRRFSHRDGNGVGSAPCFPPFPFPTSLPTATCLHRWKRWGDRACFMSVPFDDEHTAILILFYRYFSPAQPQFST